ncbi:MAG: DUF4255 domain-containing protein [Actinomycetota bacterium]|nr:DUF4255 domain-containing protein [Actinomycetota bacterium]
MSNFLAIATVTATLKRMLDEAVAASVPGAVANAKVTAGIPEAVKNGAADQKGINIYLYQVTPNAAWRNADLPSRGSDGRVVRRPQVALDLHYLLSFYGEDADLEPQRLLGLAVRTLNDRPILTRDAISDTMKAAVADDPDTFLKSSDLGNQVELVRFSPIGLNLEELSKLWSVFFQIPYALSVAYQGTVVLIEGADTPRTPLSVRARGVYVGTFRQPLVERVLADTGEEDPIVSTTTISIEGQNLRGDATRVRLGAVEVAPDHVSDRRISLALQPLSLLPGVHGLQVVHQALLGDPPAPHRGAESNLMPFVLRPRISGAVGTAPGASAGEVDVTVTVEPPVGRKQRVSLLLNERSAPSERAAHDYTFDAPSRDVEGAPDTTDTVTFTTSGVEDGTYLVRIQVDGADSPISVDEDPASPTFGQVLPVVAFP